MFLCVYECVCVSVRECFFLSVYLSVYVSMYKYIYFNLTRNLVLLCHICLGKFRDVASKESSIFYVLIIINFFLNIFRGFDVCNRPILCLSVDCVDRTHPN